MIRQLTFDLTGSEALTRADFFVTQSNALALQTVEAWEDWPGGKLLLLGPEGSGKSHLAHIWAELSGAAILPARGLPQVDIAELSGARVVVEDADKIGPAEAQLFHLHNLLTSTEGVLLMTATTPPRDWGLTLPDLLSRLQSAPVARLETADEGLLAAVLVKLFADRQLAVAPNLIPYLISRMPRSVGAARALVAALDKVALAEGRAITRALAAPVLDSLGNG